MFYFAEILDGESGERDLKIALDQLRDDQMSKSHVIAMVWYFFTANFLFVVDSPLLY